MPLPPAFGTVTICNPPCLLLRHERLAELSSSDVATPSQKENIKPAMAASPLQHVAESSVVAPQPPREVIQDEAGFAPQGFTEEERQAAWAASRFGSATAGHARPVALWIVGPSAVGKSTLAAQVAPNFGIPMSATWSEASAEVDLDAVVVDGAFFREVHATYQRWVKSADWAAAYPAMKKVINHEKDELLRAAARHKKHLIVPQTCLNLNACLSMMRELAQAGYTNHVLAIVAPRDEVARRGRAREREDGKRYAPWEFDASIAAVGPMIAASNGRFQVMRAVQPGAPSGVRRLLGVELASGSGGQEVRLQEDVVLR